MFWSPVVHSADLEYHGGWHADRENGYGPVASKHYLKYMCRVQRRSYISPSTVCHSLVIGDDKPVEHHPIIETELRQRWHHRNNMSVDSTSVICLQLNGIFSVTDCSSSGKVEAVHYLPQVGVQGHLGWNRTLARLVHRFYWPGMPRDVQ